MPVPERPDGVILAAGYSSRMSRFKPLCPVGSEILIDRVARILLEGGAGRIFAVTGHRADELEERLRRREVTPLFNEDYDRGMFSSVQRAVRGLPGDSPGFLLLPVDYPFVLPATVRKMSDSFRRGGADVFFPLCGSRRGHPPAIGASLYGEILSGDGGGGLRKLLNDPRLRGRYVETSDEGILCDADTDEDLEELLGRFKDRIL